MKLFFWIYLRVLAVVVYVQYIGSQFYDPTSEGLAEPVYRIIDPLMVLGMVISVYYSYQRKRAVDAGSEGGVTREYLEANGTFYLGVALLVRPALELGRFPVRRSRDDPQLAMGSD